MNKYILDIYIFNSWTKDCDPGFQQQSSGS